MRIFSAILFILFTGLSSGQVLKLTDTIMISEVVVRAKSGSGNISAYTRAVFDSADISAYSMDNLSAMITETAPVYIKSYGPGGIGTISYRGTGPGHTRITWNNIDLYSPMLGQTDLSLIPAGFIDEIDFLHGGASLTDGRAGIGGQIDIVTKPDWNNGINILAEAEAGSFGKYSGLAKVRAGNRKLQSVTKFYHQQALNNFMYLNDVATSEPYYERRRNAETSVKAFMQEIHLRNHRNSGSLYFWYQASDRSIPAMLLNTYTGEGERQYDESYRALVSHEHFSGENSYSLSASFISDELNYINNTALIDSRNRSNTFNLNSSSEIDLSDRLRLKIILDNSLVTVNSVNYDRTINRNISTLTISANTSLSGISSFIFLVSDRLVNGRFIFPDFSAGANIGLPVIPGTNLKLNLSRISRIPSLNDLYWSPGGNPDLKNEYTWSGESSIETHIQSGGNISMVSEVTSFYNVIRDLIQWLPGDLSYWTPVNMKNVNTYGLETSVEISFRYPGAEAGITGNYSFTRAGEKNTGEGAGSHRNQLIYVPENLLNIKVYCLVSNLSFSITNNYTGRRYTTPDNTVFLPPYLLSNASVGYKIKFRKNNLHLKFDVKNILNADYQAIAYYPMPGRAFYFSLSGQVIK